MSIQFSSNRPIERTLSGATTPSQSGPGSDGNKGVLKIPQSFSINGALPSDYLVSYPGHSFEKSYPSAEKQLSAVLNTHLPSKKIVLVRDSLSYDYQMWSKWDSLWTYETNIDLRKHIRPHASAHIRAIAPPRSRTHTHAHTHTHTNLHIHTMDPMELFNHTHGRAHACTHMTSHTSRRTLKHTHSHTHSHTHRIHSAGAVEYADCISEEG